MNSVNEKSMKFNKRVKVNFDGGDLTGDAGILLYKEFDDAIGLSRMIEKMVHAKDEVIHRKHEKLRCYYAKDFSKFRWLSRRLSCGYLKT